MAEIGASIFSRNPIATGVAVAAVTLIPHAVLPDAMSLAFAAVLLGIIAGVYFGFAVAKGSSGDQLTEFCVAALFGGAALAGIAGWIWCIPLAYFGHAVWDLAHHNSFNFKLVAIPQWYIPWCVTIDVIVGLALAVLWGLRGVL